MLLQVHDELVFEAPEAEAEAAITVIKRVMEGAAEPAVALSVRWWSMHARRGTGTRRIEGLATRVPLIQIGGRG